MQFKPFPPEKRAYILQKPFEEFEQFFQELPSTEQHRLASSFPHLHGGGFRSGSRQLLKVQLQRLWSDAKNPESSHNALAWKILADVWQAWIASHPELHALLEHYNNSDDFQNDEIKPPNTYLDIECLKYLIYANFNNKIDKETIQKTYEFGYFQKEASIDSYIELARDTENIESNKAILSILEVIEKIKNDIVDLHRKNSEILNVHNSIKRKIDDSESKILQKTNDFLNKIDQNMLAIKDLEKRLTFIESISKTIEDLRTAYQQDIERISNECATRFREMQEYIDLLGATLDENSHNIAELRTSHHQLTVRDAPTADANLPSPLALNTTSNASAVISPATTPPIERCDDFLQYRLLPALAAWVPDMTRRWAELFHHAIRACRWVLIPNPAWGLAYREAMGGTATLQIVQVEPTWLCFADAWKGYVEQCWVTAHQQPERLHLLLFEDVNRALPECWARPWLDLLAGFREVLPVAEQYGWPENLRILACLAADQAALPLSKTVVQHWAAVSLRPLGEKLASPPITREGHVPWDAWQAWGGIQVTQDEGFEAQEFGPLARSVKRDLHRLQSSLQHLNPERDVTQTARNIRIKWPREYLQHTDDTDE
jgi:hypothetical protein